MNIRPVLAAVLFSLATPAPSWAQTTVKDPWVRGTVPQQRSTGLFAQITSASGGKLVAASSPVAGAVEIHEMSMADGMMQMRALAALDLPPGKTVELKPSGGYHMMLLNLKQQVKAGQTVPVTLVIEGKDGRRESVEIKALVHALGAAGHGGH